MKQLLTLVLLFFTIYSFSQSCPPNIDFEGGNFSNWACFTGTTASSMGQNSITLAASPPTSSRHELILGSNPPTNDPYGGFPTLCPYGGNFSVKLGNDNVGMEAEGLSYTFQIPVFEDTFSLTYFYAVVFEDPGHDASEQPRFFVTAYDVVTGALINCASYNYISTASIPGFQQSILNPNVLYKNWTPASIDFSGLAGRQVRLEFKTADCTLGAHFGYAYVDVATGCGGVISVAALCGNTNAVSLNGPYGFQTYTWYNDNYSVVLGNQQNVTITPAPPPNTIFHVDMVPYPGFGCRDTADALVTQLPVPDTPVAQTNYDVCQFQSPPILTATPNNPNALIWYTVASGGVGSPDAPIPSTASAGTFNYYVSQKKLFGCESDLKEIKVIVTPTPVLTSFGINNDRQCQNTNNFIFTNAATNTVAGSVYQWDFNDASTSALQNPTHTYTNYGTFNVTLKVSNTAACFAQTMLPVNVVAKPVTQIVYPLNICEQQTSIALTENSSVPGNSGIINQWNWTIGTTNVSLQNPLPFLANAGPLHVKLVVKTTEGCISSTSEVTIPIHYRPIVNLKYDPPCSNAIVHFSDLSGLPVNALPDIINKWNWLFDNTLSSVNQDPSLLLTAGMHHVRFSSETNIGCKGIAVDSTFIIFEKPHINLRISDSCINRVIQYAGTSTGASAVVNWYWEFGDRQYQGTQSITTTFTKEGYYPLTLIGKSAQGCSDTIHRPFSIYKNHAFAGHDTIVAMNQAVQLNAGVGQDDQYNWSPSIGLNNSQISNPVAILDRDQLYELNSVSVYGCDSRSKIFIKRYKGPELYIPTAFTPNADGTNDVLYVFPVGIKTFHSFSVYNRVGVCMFSTKNYLRGWDGSYKGKGTDPGNYVVIANAVDFKGKTISKKLNVLLLR
ncbi:MAG: PKD domain-containing protein [Ferruginibacter sp.]|nr:PKD domain-containing protein [Ferruginibacter sp.]